jgi:hypothetical protein
MLVESLLPAYVRFVDRRYAPLIEAVWHGDPISWSRVRRSFGWRHKDGRQPNQSSGEGLYHRHHW